MKKYLYSSIEKWGEEAVERLRQWGDEEIFLGKITASTGAVLRSPRKLRWSFVWYYLDLCGAKALPIVLLICYLLGVTLGFQSAVQLRGLGAEMYIADLVGIATLKEFGPLMVALIATGRAGSAFAAEIGSMKAEEEISALQTMGISPVRFLVLPKLLAMLVAMPILTIFGDAASLLGGLSVSVVFTGLTTETYLMRTTTVLSPTVFLLGVFKSFVFAVMITLIGCRQGFLSSADAQGVGRAATNAVVKVILGLTILDSLITVIYSILGY